MTDATPFSLALPNGLNISGLTWGDPNARPVLALHGWLDNANSFAPLAVVLSRRQDIYFLAIDLPGHGLSDPLPQGCMAYHFIDSVSVIDMILTTLGWSDCILLGHSLGGAMASIYAGVQPDRVQRSILIDAVGPLVGAAEQSPEKYAAFLQQYIRFRAFQPKVHRTFEDAVHARAYRSDIELNEARILAERGVAKSANGYYWRYDVRLQLPSPLYMTEQQVEAFLGNIAMPIQLIRARQGLRIPEAILRRRLECIQDIQYNEMEGGHHVHMSHPESVADLIKL